MQIDRFGTPGAFAFNVEREYQRNGERYQLLRWAQTAFRDLRVVPPGTGIVHQVNLEFLATVITDRDDGRGGRIAFPDSVVGTDSHTTMVNGLGVLGYGVGGIEAEAVLLGQPLYQPMPHVVGVRLHGALPRGSTATDLVLVVTEMLRAHGVVGAFVEFAGDGLATLALADRTTISNMSPEFGATATLFPIDDETLTYLRLTGRSPERLELVERYAKAQGLWRLPGDGPIFDELLELDLASVEPSVAGPRRPQDRVPLQTLRENFQSNFPNGLDANLADLGGEEPVPGNGVVEDASAASFPASDPPSFASSDAVDDVAPAADPVDHTAAPVDVRAYRPVDLEIDGRPYAIRTGSVAIAAITSCTNTSNPTVMVGAGLLARNAVARGLRVEPTVKTSLAPGSRAVTGYLEAAGLMTPLETLGFALAGYGCTTCIGNSGPLDESVARAVEDNDLVVAAVLSGNRNFEGRIHPLARASYLASPPLVVAFALAGRVDIDLTTEPLGTGSDGRPVFLADIWPEPDEIRSVIAGAIDPELFRRTYATVFDGDDAWRLLPIPSGDRYAWADGSTYIAKPPFFDGLSLEPRPVGDIEGARVLAVLGDSVTTDHISPAGSIAANSPAGQWLQAHGVGPLEFNSYGARRGHHEVMMRGTFANIRLRNRLVEGTEGPYTVHLPDGEQGFIYDVAMRYAGGRRAAGDHRRPRIRLGFVAGLGREGSGPAGRPVRAGRELRTHPSLEPGGHGRAAAPVQARRECRVPRPDRPRGLFGDGARRRPHPAPDRCGHGVPRPGLGRRRGPAAVRRHRPARRADRRRVLPRRRDPAGRPAPPRHGGLTLRVPDNEEAPGGGTGGFLRGGACLLVVWTRSPRGA